MKRVISMMLLTLACLFSAACAHPQGYIDFTQPEGPRPAVEQTGVKPLRIAFASVMSPRETQAGVSANRHLYFSKQQWPAVLIQRRTYEVTECPLGQRRCRCRLFLDRGLRCLSGPSAD